MDWELIYSPSTEHTECLLGIRILNNRNGDIKLVLCGNNSQLKGKVKYLVLPLHRREKELHHRVPT